jgi:predicted transcriptional regulator
MNVHELFSSKERVRILRHIIYLERDFGVSEISRKLKISKGLVSKYFNILVKNGILEKAGKKFVVRKDSHIVKGIKIMLNLEQLEVDVFERYEFVKAAGLYGRCAKGMNTESSGIDLWIEVDRLGEKDIHSLVSELKKRLNNARILLLDEKKIKKIKGDDPLFYCYLRFTSIVIYRKKSKRHIEER